MTTWRHLGAVPPRRLVNARLQLHRAAQLVSAVGRSYLPAVPDDSHTNMRVLARRGLLAGHFTPTRPKRRAALEMAALRLLVSDATGRAEALSLDGRRVEEAWAWLERQLGRPLTRFAFDLPPGPGSGDEPFHLNGAAAFRELAAWYGNADAALRAAARPLRRASPVRCWPHHFDVGFVVPIPRGRGRDPGSIGVGLSPGDESYPEPYWYVTPYPYARRPARPALAGGGRWHTRAWFGAVLTGSRLVAAGGSRAQEARAGAFLRSSIAACRRLIAAADS